MKILATSGRFLFAVPMLVFGMMHFMMGDQLVGMVPIPGGMIWIWLSGLLLAAAGLAIMTGKMAAPLSGLLGGFLLLTALTVHLPMVMGGDMNAVGPMLKDMALAGSAFMLMGHFQSGEGSGGQSDHSAGSGESPYGGGSGSAGVA
ncbi:MAG: hypothetical protein RQ745_11920 [Longimicrobiales bacterium]|nr:hypothetical protein [Longimicrobiales bacterium]